MADEPQRTLANWGHHPGVFILATAVYFGAFGEIYSLFPATCGDTFGSKFATTNAAMLYTAKGAAALVVPLSSLLASRFGWHWIFFVGMCLNITAAVLALLVVKPMRKAFILNGRNGISPRDRHADAPGFAFATAHSQHHEDKNDTLDTLSPSR